MVTDEGEGGDGEEGGDGDVDVDDMREEGNGGGKGIMEMKDERPEEGVCVSGLVLFKKRSAASRGILLRLLGLCGCAGSRGWSFLIREDSVGSILRVKNEQSSTD